MKTRYAVKAQNTRLIKCKVKVTMRTGETHFYYGLFRSTSDAVLMPSAALKPHPFKQPPLETHFTCQSILYFDQENDHNPPHRQNIDVLIH